MANPSISREDVHRLAEACSDAGDAFQPIATRLLRDQRRISRFIENNAASLGMQESQTALYMSSVCLRIFDQMGGRMARLGHRDFDEAAARVRAVATELLPLDAELPARARAISWRAQPHLLDEILWALYEREEKKEGELDLSLEGSGLVYLTMWAIVEAMDANWTPAPVSSPPSES
jgi:hypothetical protein